MVEIKLRIGSCAIINGSLNGYRTGQTTTFMFCIRTTPHHLFVGGPRTMHEPSIGWKMWFKYNIPECDLKSNLDDSVKT